MNASRKKFRVAWRTVLAGGFAAVVCLAAFSSAGAEGIDPNADEILKSMSSYLGGLSTFDMNADIDYEIITNDGQKIQLSSEANMVIERPAKFRAQRKGMFADVDIVYDGNTLTLFGKKLNVYKQIEASGTIEDGIRTLETATGIEAPGADLLFADPYSLLISEVEDGKYIGTTYVNGAECHHLAFRKDKVDWQMWVRTGDEPLPMKYVITSKWITGAPQYAVRLRDWNTNPKINPDQFVFSVPPDAKMLGSVSVNELGEIELEEGQ